MTTTHHLHVRSGHVGFTRRPVALVTAGAAAAACAIVVITSIAGSGEPAAVDLAVEPVEPVEADATSIVEPTSALLDGRAFAVAVGTGVVGVESPSILLDGAAFELAVTDAVAFITNGSALLHGTGFSDAVAAAVTAATA